MSLAMDSSPRSPLSASNITVIHVSEEPDCGEDQMTLSQSRSRGGSLSSCSSDSKSSVSFTSVRPKRNRTFMSIASSSSSTHSRASDPSYFYPSSPLTSATSLPQSFNSFTSAFSAGSLSLLPPPYAASPLSGPADARCLLTMDGGGVRGIFAPLFLLALQKHLPESVDVRTLLDLVGGTSTGGVAALLFARLGLPIEKCIEVYRDMPKKLFGKRGHRMRKLCFLFTSAQHSTARQKKIYRRVVEEAIGDVDAKLLSNEQESVGTRQCPVFVVAVDTSNVSNPAVFTSYYLHSMEDGVADVDPISIVTAALATSAAPTYYFPTVHGGRTYVDGGLGYNNPSEIAIKQLAQLYGSTAFAHTIISLGTGRRTQFSYTHPKSSRLGFRSGISNMFNILNTFALSVTDSESVHKRMAERFEPTGAYYRFNPPGLEDIVLDDWTAVDRALKTCQEYLDQPETQEKLIEVAYRLLAAKGITDSEHCL